MLKSGRRMVSRLGSVIDDAVLSAMRLRFDRRPSPPPDRARPAAHREDRRAQLHDIIRFYQPLGDRFFPRPPPAAPRLERHARLAPVAGAGLAGDDDGAGGEVIDLAWPSGYVPAWEPARASYLAFAPNRVARARVYRHLGPRGEGPRPLAVCVHGYRAGRLFVDERAFQARRLYRLGLDVALPTLPFHGGRGGAEAPTWPSVHPARTNEGFGQAIHDLRALLGWLRAEAPERPVVLIGMSLGGYTAALAATIVGGDGEAPLSLVVPVIPVASFPDLFWEHGADSPARAQAEREGITRDLLVEAMAVHTPLARAPRLAAERVLVIAADGDRIVPPVHATRLARHFGCVEMRLAGGHVLQLGREEAFGALVRRMTELSIL